jgi:hypothetical protein
MMRGYGASVPYPHKVAKRVARPAEVAFLYRTTGSMGNLTGSVFPRVPPALRGSTLLSQSIRRFAGKLGSSTFSALSTPATGRFLVSSRPSCARTEA